MLIEYVDNFYTRKWQRKYDGFHISEAAKCPRQMYFKATSDKVVQFEPKVMRIFDNGDAFHMRMMRVLFQIWKIRIVASEINIPENDLIRGTCDAIIGIKDENYIVDFKSMNGFVFDKMVKSGTTQPKYDHFIQVQLYMHFFKVKKAIILYESKNNQEMKEYIVEYDESVCNKTLDFLEDMNTKIKNKSVPEKPIFEEEDKWKCQYCSYSDECAEVDKK